MADRTIALRITADVKGLVAGLKTAEQASSQWVTKNEQHLSKLSTGFLAAGAGVTAFAALAVKKFADFDAAMSGVQAATMETTQNMGLLREAALKAGADTMYTATDAANAITDMGKAGVSTADILNGGLSGALNLAAAAQMDVAQAAEISATTMNQFGLEGRDATHISDLLAAAAGKAMGDVTDMAGALKFVGPVAHQMGISLEETTGVIAELAQQGILGEQAGTSLRGMIMALTSPSKIAAEAISSLGLEVYGANGKFVGLAGVAEQMKSKMQGLTDAERDEAFGRIFGNEQITTARILYAGGAAEVQKWTKAVNDSGFASEQARIKTDNLKGDIERLGGSIDTALIQSGSGANDSLRTLTQTAEGLVNAFSGLPDGVQQGTLAIVGAGGLVSLAMGGLGKLVIGVNNVRAAMTALKISAGAATVATAAIGGALLLGAGLLVQWAEAAQRSKQNTDDFKSTLDEATGAITTNTKVKIAAKLADEGWARVYANMGGDVMDLTGYILGNADAIARVNAVLDAQPKEKYLWGTFDSAAVDNERKGLDALAGSLKNSQEQTELERQTLKGLGDAASGATPPIEDNRTALQKLAAGAGDATQAISDLIDAQNKLAGVAISEAEAQIAFQQAIDDAAASVKENGRNLDIGTEKGRANKSALLDLASAGWDLVTSMQANGASQAEMQQSLASSRESFLKAATSMGMSKDEAGKLADQLNLIPENVSVAVAVNTLNAQKAIDNFIGLNNSRSILLDVGGTVARTGQRVARASGGILPGAPSSRDNMLIAAASGEFVVNAAATSRNRATLEAINSGVRGYADGGYVTPRYYAAPAASTPAVSAGQTNTFYLTVADPTAAALEVTRRLSMLGV